MGKSSETYAKEGFIAKGTRVSGKTELVYLLRNWLSASKQSTIGNPGNFGGSRCILVALNNGLWAVLNLDTTREAVERYVASADINGPEQLWSVIPNRRGRLNKVVFSEDGAEIPGWYCYLTEPASSIRKV
jgi:hypothetical protein